MIFDPGFAFLKSRLIDSTGMSYYCDRDDDLAERIGTRLEELGLSNCEEYTALLSDEENGAAELEVIVSRLNIGETYFFRDQAQMDAIRDVVLPAICERNRFKRTVRIWSAGCGNGSEPYSLAIIVRDLLSDRLRDWKVTILGTDISQPSLISAFEAQYGEWALRSTSEDIRDQCFLYDGHRWTLRPEYRQMVSFAKMNLADTAIQWSLDIGSFDLILCRNVMIYFSAELKRVLLHRFHDSLENGGWLIVGAVEHDLENFRIFRNVPLPGATIYQKPETPPLLHTPKLTKPTSPGTPPPEPAAVADPPPPRPDLASLRLLANRGEWEHALGYCTQLLKVEPLNPVVHFYHALVLDNRGLAAEAEQALRRAIYLDRYYLLAHYHLGLALTRDHKPRTAARSFENVLDLSTEMQDDQAVTDGDGITVADLKGLARMHLQNLRTYDAVR